MNPAACTLVLIAAATAAVTSEGEARPARSRSAGCASRSAARSSSTASTLRSAPARRSRCWGPTAPARPPPFRSCPRSCTPTAVRAVIGVTGQFSAVDNLLTGEENLLLMADLHHLGRADGRRRAAALLEQFGLAEAAGKTVATYSGGMRRRLDLAMTLIGDPRIIFLDEPTTGLDPRSRRMMWQTIRQLVAGGVTIFLTTQQLDEADQLADQIAVLDHGTVVAAGSPEELKRSIPGGHARLRFADAAGLGAAERALGGAF